MNADWLTWRGRPVVYRCYDNGRLVYVGCSVNVELRLETHKARAFWWSPTIRTVIRIFPSLHAARAAELTAIRNEWPLYNIHSRRESWEAADIRALITAIERGKSGNTAYNRARVRRLRYRLHVLGETS